MTAGLDVTRWGQSEPIVCVHGCFGWGEETFYAQRELADEYELLLVDRRGYGDSVPGKRVDFEPPVLLGKNGGSNAVELVLAALGVLLLGRLRERGGMRDRDRGARVRDRGRPRRAQLRSQAIRLRAITSRYS